MKRLVWIVLFAFAGAVAQVGAVDLGVKRAAKCSCCAQAGDCGAPVCTPTPVAVSAVFDVPGQVQLSERPAPAAIAATPAVRKFYASFVIVPIVAPRLRAAPETGPASAPLFEAHCSWLI